ncbi:MULTISPECIES: hypothetical protein [unclassified Nocardioides]|uniref:hypothetical protein n=1 Tax=unclassified Nocardioides TaxID=2615069 RepID=UPI00360BBDD2
MREGDVEDPWADDHDPDDPDAPPYWYAGQHLPPDARAMGLTHHVPEGAILDFAGRLDATRPGHRIAAWVLLVIFGLPVVFAALRVLYVF